MTENQVRKEVALLASVYGVVGKFRRIGKRFLVEFSSKSDFVSVEAEAESPAGALEAAKTLFYAQMPNGGVR